MVLSLGVFAFHHALIFARGQFPVDRLTVPNGRQDGGENGKIDPKVGHTSRKASAESFLKVWRDLQADFVSDLRSLLAEGATGTDPRLVRLVRRHVFPPAKNNYKMSYDFTEPPQAQVAIEYFKKKGVKRGFFVECGGLDGERSSNTYHLEKAGWRGLLVETDADYFLQSLGKNRRAWKINAALCPSNTPSIVRFREVPNSGRGVLTEKGQQELPCLPLQLILMALNRTSVDFFSLDIEGLEMKLLQSLPYKDLDITAITMEYNHNKETRAEITKFMSTVGYNLHREINKIDHPFRLYTHDLFFVKRKKK